MDFEPRFLNGVFLSLHDRSDEILVYGPEGVRKARTIRRRPEDEQWKIEEVLAVRGTPLRPNPTSEDQRIRTKMDPGLSTNAVVGDPVTKEEIATEVCGSQRRFRLLRKEVRAAAERIGYTQGCPGCRAVENDH